MLEIDEFAENSLDSVSEPTAADLLGITIASTHDPITGAPVAIDLHPNGHMFNRVKGINYCACDCEHCNGSIPAGKHWPTCICGECECDG